MYPYPEFPGIDVLRMSNPPGSGYSVKLVDAAGNSIIKWKHGMCSDFRDIRFSDFLGRKIPYHIESKTDGVSAVVWIRTTNTGTILLHYGNQAAISESDGNAVFELFDDFEGVSGTSPDSNTWTCETLGTGGTIQLEGDGSVSITPTQVTSSSTALISVKKFTQGIIIGCRDKVSHSSYPDTIIGTTEFQPENGTSSGQWHPTLGPGIAYVVQLASGTTGNAIKETFESSLPTSKVNAILAPYSNLNIYHIHEYTWGPSVIKWTVNGNVVAEGTNDLVATGSCRIGFAQGEYTNGNGGIRTLDWIYVRKYLATEPTFSVVSSSYSASRVAPLFETASGTTTLEISSTVELTGSEYANILLNKFLSSEVSKTGSSTASINLAKYISSTTESTGSETANILLQKLISCSSALVGSSTANISLQKFISSISELTGSSEAAIYLQTSDLSILAEMVGAATANISVSKSISSTADVAGNSTAKATVFKYVSSESASQIESLVNAILTKYITSETGLSGSATVNITRYNYIGSLGLIEISATATVGGGTAISLDFVYPLTVYIFLKQRTVTIQKNVRTVTFK